MNQIGPIFLSVVSGAFVLAAVALVLASRSQTPQVLTAGGNALSQIIGAAVSPMTGVNPQANTFSPASFASNAIGAFNHLFGG